MVAAEAGALEALGWSAFFQSQLDAIAAGAPGGEPLAPARVTLALRGRCQLAGAGGPLEAVIAGRLVHEAAGTADLPTVGDWVLVRAPAARGPHAIARLLARRSAFARKVAGRRTDRQIVAANVDRVFVVTSVGADLSPRRLERYLAAASEGGAVAEIVLSKADLIADAAPLVEAARRVAQGARVSLISAHRGDGIDELRATLRPGETVAVLGSSGVGKSALVNRLLGEERQSVGAVRAHDDRGKHTTTHRELFVLPGGALLIDTPGMRELALWADDVAPGAFADVDALAAACRFRDCGHQGEPGCRVAEAVERGELDAGRVASYQKLGRELERLHRSQDGRAQHEERRRRARFSKVVREATKAKRR